MSTAARRLVLEIALGGVWLRLRVEHWYRTLRATVTYCGSGYDG